MMGGVFYISIDNTIMMQGINIHKMIINYNNFINNSAKEVGSVYVFGSGKKYTISKF